MSRKELYPDLYAPTAFTSSSSPTGFASYAQMDNSLMEAYRDRNRQRGLDDSSDSDDSDLEPYRGGGGAVVANTGRRASPTSAVITLSTTSEEEDDDDEEEELHNRHRVSTGEMPNTVVVVDDDDEDDDDNDDDDTIDTLDLNRLDSYPLKCDPPVCTPGPTSALTAHTLFSLLSLSLSTLFSVSRVLRQYCALEGVAVQGRSKKCVALSLCTRAHTHDTRTTHATRHTTHTHTPDHRRVEWFSYSDRRQGLRQRDPGVQR